MKYLHLIWASLFRRRTRTILTLVSIVAAFLLFGLLDAVRTSFADPAAERRSLGELLPSATKPSVQPCGISRASSSCAHSPLIT